MSISRQVADWPRSKFGACVDCLDDHVWFIAVPTPAAIRRMNRLLRREVYRWPRVGQQLRTTSNGVRVRSPEQNQKSQEAISGSSEWCVKSVILPVCQSK
ncbi:AAEL002807-PA [Aedes aegypti]|uniref:AAEL002807-PA n=1 Tax=Aedes aegypti TaxID=7159 RepID=Q17H29_AEDAE|nr:AAEL002807-PA [Aedes aegypti]